MRRCDMARLASGTQDLEWARTQIAKARSADDLRQAQAILLPLELGLSLEDTAIAIGRSVSLTCKLRNRRRREQAAEIPIKQRKTALRNRAISTLEREAALIDSVITNAASGGVVEIPSVQPAIEKALGRTIALSTIYRMLARHGWRKLAPDTAHPQGDAAKREDFKKNSVPKWQKP
jgi:Winged helix-turn helix